MGGDGGSIPKRVDVVRTKGYRFVRNLGGMGYNPNLQARRSDERFGKTEERSLRWGRCAITQQPLRPPIAACRLGNLYNKEALLEGILKKNLPPHANHVKTIRNLKECNSESWKSNQGSDLQGGGGFVCPVMNKPLSECSAGVLLWSCGCVMSRKALEMTARSASSLMLPTEGTGGGPGTRRPEEMSASSTADYGQGAADDFNVTKEKEKEESQNNCKDNDGDDAKGVTESDHKECIICGASYGEDDVVTLVPSESQAGEMLTAMAKYQQKMKRTKAARDQDGADKKKKQSEVIHSCSDGSALATRKEEERREKRRESVEERGEKRDERRESVEERGEKREERRERREEKIDQSEADRDKGRDAVSSCGANAAEYNDRREESDRDRHRDSDRDRHRDSGRDRHRDSVKDRHRDSEKDGHRDSDRDRHRDSDRDRHRDSEKDRHRDSERDRHRDSEKDRHRDRDRGRHKDSDRGRHKDSDRGRHKDSDRDIHEDSDRDRHKDSDRDRHKDSDRDRHKDSDRDRHKDSDRDIHTESDRDRHRDSGSGKYDEGGSPAKKRRINN